MTLEDLIRALTGGREEPQGGLRRGPMQAPGRYPGQGVTPGALRSDPIPSWVTQAERPLTNREPSQGPYMPLPRESELPARMGALQGLRSQMAQGQDYTPVYGPGGVVPAGDDVPMRYMNQGGPSMPLPAADPQAPPDPLAGMMLPDRPSGPIQGGFPIPGLPEGQRATPLPADGGDDLDRAWEMARMRTENALSARRPRPGMQSQASLAIEREQQRIRDEVRDRYRRSRIIRPTAPLRTNRP